MKTITKLLLGLSLPLSSLALTGCEENMIYEKPGECTTLVKFEYTRHRQALHSINLIGSDAFSTSVETVHLFVYDLDSDRLVFEKSDLAANLKSASELGIGTSGEKVYMPVEITPGNYRIVAWCGLDDNNENNAFTLNEDATRGGFSDCSVKLTGNSPVNDEKYQYLYHGHVESVEVTPAHLSKTSVIPVSLTKNTNDIAVWVQHTTATFTDGDYQVVYTDSNGSMNFTDNSMMSEDKLEYLPHTTSLLTTDSEYNGSTVQAGALVAHISTSRLMADHSGDARLEVRNKEGKTVFSIPFIKYLTEMQTFTSDHQYYLDCEDTYNCSFYLTGEKEDGTWTPARIIINNWTKVQNQGEDLSGDS